MFLILSLFFLLCLVVVLYLIWGTQKTVLLFIDAPDPDNAAAASAIWRHILGKRGHLHIILTGRPTNLRNIKDVHQAQRESVPEHAEYLLEDSAARISNYLERCDIPADVFTIYHGGIARDAPIPDSAHDWDFLFDRRDLVTGKEEDRGEVLDPEEYTKLVSRYTRLPEDVRERDLLSLLRQYPLAPLEELCSCISKPWRGRITIFLGGPATAVAEVFRRRQWLCRKVKDCYGMFGSLHPGEKTLLPNQFNIACDLKAAREVFCSDLFSHVEQYLITTETCKQAALVPSASDMERRGINPHVVRLHSLWESLHRHTPQPIFDVIPVMAALPSYKACFTWLHKSAIIQVATLRGKRLEVFQFVDSEKPKMYVSDDCFNSDGETFMHFLYEIWS